MKRFPLLTTLIAAAAFAALVWLGLWQGVTRRNWKHGLIAEATAAPNLPPLEPRDYYDAMIGKRSVQYRRAVLPCSPGRVLPYDLRPGASAGGDSGYFVLVSCRPNHKPPDIVAVAGWTKRPDTATRPITVDATFDGIIIEHPYGDAPARPQFMLIPKTAVAGLDRPRLPEPDDLSDNHLSYAFQWAGMAAALAGVYGVWLRRRLRS